MLIIGANEIPQCIPNKAHHSLLSSRFLLNLSNEEKKDPIKLCSYIELAHWYYLDLMRPEDASLPGCNLKEFMRACKWYNLVPESHISHLYLDPTVFQHCPWLLEDSTKDLEKLIAEWKMHKFKKPVRGAIVLNQDLTKVNQLNVFRLLFKEVRTVGI